MLDKNYDNVHLGLNYISLILGIIEQENGRKNLIISNKHFSKTSNWLTNLGELDVKVLNGIGKKFGIYPLENIFEYIQESNTILYLNERCVELSHSPYLNIKELMRKFPKNFLDVFTDFFDKHNEAEFNEEFDQFLIKVSDTNSKSFISETLKESEFPKIVALIKLYESYLSFDDEFIKQFNHVLQVMFQAKFTPNISEENSIYLFLALISKRYRVDIDKFREELLFHYKKLGGDIKDTQINDWGIDKNQLKYLTLDSIDGAIELQNAYFYGMVTDIFPFDAKVEGDQYLSINFECYIDNNFTEFYQDKRLVFSTDSRIGSDFPYWELSFKENKVYGSYAYIEKQGSKPSFYFHQTVEDIYQSLKTLLPGLLKADWVTRVKLEQGEDVWFETPKGLDTKVYSDKVKLYDRQSGHHIKGISHLGAKSSGSMGLYSYLLDCYQIS